MFGDCLQCMSYSLYCLKSLASLCSLSCSSYAHLWWRLWAILLCRTRGMSLGDVLFSHFPKRHLTSRQLVERLVFPMEFTMSSMLARTLLLTITSLQSPQSPTYRMWLLTTMGCRLKTHHNIVWIFGASCVKTTYFLFQVLFRSEPMQRSTCFHWDFVPSWCFSRLK